MGGLAGGLIGAGLFGLLAGNGLFSGLGSMMSILGLLLQVAIVFFIIRFAIGYFRRKSPQPAMAGGPANFTRQPPQPDWQPAPAAAQPAQTTPPVPQMPELVLAEADFNSFERLLGEIQEAFGKDDRIGLSQRATPEMANIFNVELNDLARKGFASRVSDVKLLQGDLSEAWREPNAEYATVAMRYAITDVKVERASGRIVDLFEGTDWELSRAEPDAHCFDVSPDGRRIAFEVRQAAGGADIYLLRLVDGKPGFVIDPSCTLMPLPAVPYPSAPALPSNPGSRPDGSRLL